VLSLPSPPLKYYVESLMKFENDLFVRQVCSKFLFSYRPACWAAATGQSLRSFLENERSNELWMQTTREPHF